jgi:hypothetical protein
MTTQKDTFKDSIEEITQQLVGATQGVDREERVQELVRLLTEAQAMRQVVDVEEVIASLRKQHDVFREHHDFKPGDIVVWKPGCKNRRRPSYGEPAIVAEVLDTPVSGDTVDSGTAYFREPLDLIIGLLDEDGDYYLFHVDKRRFKPYAKR